MNTSPQTHERLRLMRESERKAAETAQRAAEAAAPVRTHNEALLAANQARIDDLERKLGYCAPAERYGIKRRIAALKAQAQEVQTQEKRQKQTEALAQDRRVQLCRDSAACLERSWQAIYPGLTEQDEGDVMLAVAIARRDDMTPDALNSAFREIEERLSAKSLAAEKQKASDAELASLKAQREAAAQQVKVAEGQLRLAQVQGATDGP